MGVDNYKTLSKSSILEVICRALEISHMVSYPIEHYSMEEIKILAKLAKQNDLVLTIGEEKSNFYQGVLLSLIKRSSLKDNKIFIDRL
ncbi:hypothetical protein KQI38_07615 [Tissierella carlieri]|uniref:hypothetical protein n=1 Tax=Tissierella carlieri TaxID=689904 RepID=UPI001C10CF02|nr:hypothetical protein [Tissierella carlieri]MBU5311894.1 hypothetical protein [Tissierella carlieri]